MSLFAVVLAYVALRSPFNKTETAKSAIAEKETDKGQIEETGQSTFAAYRKTRSASAEDWAMVNAIAAQYAPVLKELEAKRDKLLEETNTKRISLSSRSGSQTVCLGYGAEGDSG